jgi:transposase
MGSCNGTTVTAFQMKSELVDRKKNIGPVIYSQDNSRRRVACVVMDFLSQENVNVLPWPATSSNLSPIEYVCDNVERRLTTIWKL